MLPITPSVGQSVIAVSKNIVVGTGIEEWQLPVVLSDLQQVRCDRVCAFRMLLRVIPTVGQNLLLPLVAAVVLRWVTASGVGVIDVEGHG